MFHYRQGEISMTFITALQMVVFLLFTISLPGQPRIPAQEGRNVSRVVAWKPKPGLEHTFEEGYKRHLEWHRKNADTWTWHGWTLISGDRDGMFVDGTFFHQWTDLDAPVNPAGDGADNAVNVEPYAEVRSVATYEAVPGLTNLSPQHLNAPLLTFCYIEVVPGHATQFEALTTEALRSADIKAVPHAVLRPVNGATEYLLLLPAEKLSAVGTQAALIDRILQSVAGDSKYPAVVAHFRTEMARHHPEMSYIPSEKQDPSQQK
jgi:hypothetical protein